MSLDPIPDLSYQTEFDLIGGCECGHLAREH